MYPNQNWAKLPDPDPNSMYLDPQHCFPAMFCMIMQNIFLVQYSRYCIQLLINYWYIGTGTGTYCFANFR